jgi:hypothetical protein
LEREVIVVDIKMRILAIVMSLVLFYIIGKHIQKSRLKEGYAVIWGIIGFIMLWLAAWPEPFFKMTRYLSVANGLNALFLLSILFCVLYILHLSVKITKIEKKFEQLIREKALQDKKNKNS